MTDFPSYGSSISSLFQAALSVDLLAGTVDVPHIANIFCARLGLWSEVEDFSFLSHVHRHTAVVAQTFLVFPNGLEFTSEPAHSLIELSFSEILHIEERICSRFHFGVPYNCCTIHPYQLLFIRREYPILVLNSMPVPGRDPPFILLWVPSFGPPPQQFVQDVIQMRERIARTYGLVVVGPTSNLFVQLHNQNILLPCFSPAENRVREVGNNGFHGLLGWLDNQLFAVFSKVPSKEVKAVVNVGDDSLFFG